MIPIGKETISELIALGVRTTVETFGAVGRVLIPGTRAADQQSDQQIDALAQNLIEDLNYLEAAAGWTFRESMPGRDDQTLITLLNEISAHSREIQRAVVVWINLIDVLITNAEQRYGGKSGRGDIKCAEVKQVVRYLLRNNKHDLSIGDLPSSLVQAILDIVIDQVIDALVEVLNEFQMWPQVPDQPSEMSAALTTIMRSITYPFRLLLDLLGRLINWTRFALRPSTPLSPAIRSALKAVEREGLFQRQTNSSVLRDVAGLITWIRLNRDHIVGMITFIFRVVNDVEQYLELTGEEKQQLASRLVFTILRDKGFEGHKGLFYVLINSLVDSTIKGAVSIFNRHDRFQHRTLGQIRAA